MSTLSGQTVPLWVTIASSLSVGSFLGGLISQCLSTRQRHQEWVKDTKKQEWRELIGALSQSFHYLKNYSRGYELAALSGEQRKGLFEADADARRAIESRIFIAPRVYHENVLERWQLLAAEKDWNKMVGHWESLHGALILAAHKDVGIKYAAPGAR